MSSVVHLPSKGRKQVHSAPPEQWLADVLSKSVLEDLRALEGVSTQTVTGPSKPRKKVGSRYLQRRSSKSSKSSGGPRGRAGAAPAKSARASLLTSNRRQLSQPDQEERQPALKPLLQLPAELAVSDESALQPRQPTEPEQARGDQSGLGPWQTELSDLSAAATGTQAGEPSPRGRLLAVGGRQPAARAHSLPGAALLAKPQGAGVGEAGARKAVPHAGAAAVFNIGQEEVREAEAVLKLVAEVQFLLQRPAATQVPHGLVPTPVTTLLGKEPLLMLPQRPVSAQRRAAPAEDFRARPASAAAAEPASRLAQEAAGEGFRQPGLVGPWQGHSALSASCLIPAPLVRISSSSRDGRDLFGPAASLAADSVAAATIPNAAGSGGQQSACVVYDSGLEQASLTEDAPFGQSLSFDSRFESGNLQRATQIGPHEYNLWLAPDSSTGSHTQWFYFAVRCGRCGIRYKFNIVNLRKDRSLYSQGMQPVVHSAKEAATKGRGWFRAGSQVSYQEGLPCDSSGRCYYTLSFTLTLPHNRDTVHIAHCFPYTYTDLTRDLLSCQVRQGRASCMTQETLCTTLAGNDCPVVTITASEDEGSPLHERKGAFFTARVHPGESNASWMMLGLLDFLTGPSAQAVVLRGKYVFKVIPMLNPDGVIVGNYRCNLAGFDLNRVWDDPDPELHSTIAAAKGLLQQLMREREVVLFCDMHGHSRKHDVFVYGCEGNLQEQQQAPVGAVPGVPPRVASKVFPQLLQKRAPDLFNVFAGSWRVQRAKASTARVVCWQELGLVNSFTLEASFAGPSRGPLAGVHYNTAHLARMGAAVAVALLDYASPAAVAAALRELHVLVPPSAASLLLAAQSVAVAGQAPPADAQEEDGSDSDTDETSSSSGAAAALEEQRQQARRHRARTILSLSRLLPRARSNLLSMPSGPPGEAAMAAAAMLTAQGLRTVGGLGGAGLSRRRHSTSDAVSAIHMHSIQMPRPRSQRVLRDGLQLGSSGRQLKLGLPRPQALAMGAGVVPLEEGGQGWQQVLGSPQFGGAVADLPRCVAMPTMQSSSRISAIATPHNAAGSLAVTPREYALVTLSEKAEGSGYRPPGLHASQAGVPGARSASDGKAGYGPVWRGPAPAEGGPSSLSSATPWHYTFAPTSRRPPAGFLPKSTLNSRRSSSSAPKLDSVTVAAKAEVLSIGPHNAWDSSKAWAAAQASQDPQLEIKGRPVTSTGSRQIRVTV